MSLRSTTCVVVTFMLPLSAVVLACSSGFSSSDSHRGGKDSGGSGGDAGLVEPGTGEGGEGGANAGSSGEGGGVSGSASSAGSGGSGGGAAGNGSNGGNGGNASCEPLEVRRCWESESGDPLPEPATEVGDCQIGESVCQPSGTWGACQGAVGPEPREACLSGDQTGDANCNGAVADGCDCFVADSPKPCGDCGVQTCNPEDGIWSLCVGDGRASCEQDARIVCNTSGVKEPNSCVFGEVCREAAECVIGEDTLATNDGNYVLNEHQNEEGATVITEAFYDIALSVLSPVSGNPATTWIVDRARAHTQDGTLLKSSLLFLGLYVQDCVTKEWVNVDDTVFAPTFAPLSVQGTSFTLNHSYSYTLTNVLLDPNYDCPEAGATTQSVVYDGETKTVLARGAVSFVYVVEHR